MTQTKRGDIMAKPVLSEIWAIVRSRYLMNVMPFAGSSAVFCEPPMAALRFTAFDGTIGI